jgi:sugar/nucleoside kinase (ribokinase family)
VARLHDIVTDALMPPYVVCIGLATQDTVVAVPRWPAGDDRVVANDLAVAGGGPAATAAVTLARLGVRTFFVGAVGDDAVGAAIHEGLEREGVDTTCLAVVDGASPQSVVLVCGDRRAIAAHPGTLPTRELDDATRRLCREAAWVHVDHAGYSAAPANVRLSVDGGNPVDGLDLRDVALYAPTEAALRDAFGGPEGALAAGAELVVVTRGAAGATAYASEGAVVDAPGCAVDVVSTLGAGDVFHGALLAGLVREQPLGEALAFANECAALSCRALDGRSAIPRLEEVAP